ncbi:MAG TPA: hypothetical protein VH089_15560 [Streptosporangiaceae bacterium]|jgi:hypothetical protein|nr:hypothetical protein [Streptosporangiaceae bacterium]
MTEAQPETQFDIEAWYETSARKPRDWRRWMRLNLTTGTLIATASAVAAVLTALFAIGQIDAANGQKVVAQQSQLLTLVIDIEQQPAQHTAAAHGLTGSQLDNVGTEYQDELTSYAEAAQLLIATLGPGQVTNFEYVQVGKALAMTGNNATAVADFQQAATGPGNTPDTIAAAYRNEAGILYGLEEPTLAHQEMMAAVRAFAGQYSDVAAADKDNNVAQTFFADAGSEIGHGDCRTAQSDMAGGRHYLQLLHPGQRDQEPKDLQAEDNRAYQARCG